MCFFRQPAPIVQAAPEVPKEKTSADIQDETEKERLRLGASTRGFGPLMLNGGFGQTVMGGLRGISLGGG